MAVNTIMGNTSGISSLYGSLTAATAADTTATDTTATDTTAVDTEAAVYEKSEDTAQTASKIDYDTIDRLKADAEERTAQLRGIVEKLLLKQSGTVLNSEGLASMYRRLEVDEETRAQAQEDISEDGYWGVEQTSDRIVDFAKAMAGDDPELAQQMIDAVKEGFEQAAEEWGEDLPELSQNTMSTTLSKLEEWLASLNGTSSDATDETAEVTGV